MPKCYVYSPLILRLTMNEILWLRDGGIGIKPQNWYICVYFYVSSCVRMYICVHMTYILIWISKPEALSSSRLLSDKKIMCILHHSNPEHRVFKTVYHSCTHILICCKFILYIMKLHLNMLHVVMCEQLLIGCYTTNYVVLKYNPTFLVNARLNCSRRTSPTAWLLMLGFLASFGHYQQRYFLSRIKRSLSTTKRAFKEMRHRSVGKS